jgi:hypothetical protein
MLFIDYLRGQMITGEKYRMFWTNKKKIFCTRTRSHASGISKTKIAELEYNLPPQVFCSPDLAPCDFPYCNSFVAVD